MGTGRRAGQGKALALVAIVMGLAIGALQWGPALFSIPESAGATVYGLPPGRWIELLVPAQLGSIPALGGAHAWFPGSTSAPRCSRSPRSAGRRRRDRPWPRRSSSSRSSSVAVAGPRGSARRSCTRDARAESRHRTPRSASTCVLGLSRETDDELRARATARHHRARQRRGADHDRAGGPRRAALADRHRCAERGPRSRVARRRRCGRVYRRRGRRCVARARVAARADRHRADPRAERWRAERTRADDRARRVRRGAGMGTQRARTTGAAAGQRHGSVGARRARAAGVPFACSGR